MDVQRAGDRRPFSWRLDVALLHGTHLVEKVRDKIHASLSETDYASDTWDRLKDSWHGFFIEAGKEAALKRTELLNNLVKRTKIVRRGGAATLLMQEYLETLKDRYTQILHLSSRTASYLLNRNHPVSDGDILRYVRNNEITLEPPPRIEEVTLPDGSVSHEASEIERVVASYFQKLFTPDAINRSAVPSFLSGLPTLPETMQTQLTRKADLHELFNVVRKMKSGTSPGKDGFLTEFYRTFWPLVGPFLLITLNGFLSGQPLPPLFKEGRITLIPKGESSNLGDPQRWRPITFLNSDYKILTSLLANRLRAMMPFLISPLQTCSVVDRSIFSSFSLVRDSILYANICGVRGCLVSLDQEKAFDRVKQFYPFAVLQYFGFPEQFIRLLRALYQNFRAELVVNGRCCPSFPVLRGVRQGCSLSPMLFVLCIDPFLRKLQQCRQVHGFPMRGRDTVVVSAYADDVLLFLRNSDSLLLCLRIFEEYGSDSGARLNSSKPKALSVGGFRETLPVWIEYRPTLSILSVLFDGEGVSVGNWSELYSQMSRQIMVDNHFELSFREKAYLIKSVFCSKLWHVVRVSLPPSIFLCESDIFVVLFLLVSENRACVQTNVASAPP